MMEETFKKMGETFGAMKREMQEIFEGEKSLQSGKLSIRIRNGNVDIDGPIEELRINGKLVRFSSRGGA